MLLLLHLFFPTRRSLSSEWMHFTRGRRVAYFIGLKMTDEMPLHIRGHQRSFRDDFLWPVFRKDPLPGRIQGHHLFDGPGFGNSHQDGIVGLASFCLKPRKRRALARFMVLFFSVI
jgi:hypothetical protein